MSYWEYQQNNSGGRFIEPATTVWVQADTAVEANQIAEKNGIYFDPFFKIDCQCCGNRWRLAEEAYDQPFEPGEWEIVQAKRAGILAQIVIKGEQK